MPEEQCPLCCESGAALLHRGGKASGFRDFAHCRVCGLVFVPRAQILDAAGQKARYLQHNNDVEDPDYRRFLGRMWEELRPLLPVGATGLDYGAGPGPALQRMIIEDGFEANIYDIYFHPDTSVLARTYDFVTCTETVEHFSEPSSEFDRIDGLLRPGGWLGVMTGMLDDWREFPSWYYHRDPTHVNFFSRTTMLWVAEKYGWTAQFPKANVTLFRQRPQKQERPEGQHHDRTGNSD